jgi:hypothetical protein
LQPDSVNPASGEQGGRSDISLAKGVEYLAEVVTVPISALRPGESPRLNGQDKAHIARLAELDTPVPPILVDRRTMKVIDGMHRLIAASSKGRETVEVRFFDGSAADAFLWGVKENVAHGLPLSLADRRSAASRIILSHPHLSDRALGELVGLAGTTVASIRRRVADRAQPSSTRVGRDGKVRPLNGVEARRRVADLLAEQPEASLREVARCAGVSPMTVSDVRRRLARGETPAQAQSAPAARDTPPGDHAEGTTADHAADNDATHGETTTEPGHHPQATAAKPRDAALQSGRATALEKLLRDPSLRHSDSGRYLVRLLQYNAAGERDWPRVLTSLPPYCLATVAVLARRYSQMWLNFAQELDERAKVLDPWADEA